MNESKRLETLTLRCFYEVFNTYSLLGDRRGFIECNSVLTHLQGSSSARLYESIFRNSKKMAKREPKLYEKAGCAVLMPFVEGAMILKEYFCQKSKF